MSSHEIELKFGFDPEALPALAARFTGEGSRREHLQAHYFDTPARLLAQHRIALRLRREGDRWVQTLKAQGRMVAHRLEHNATVLAPEPADGAAVPPLDLSRHDGTPAGDALQEVLQAAGAPAASLQPVYGTDLWRRSLQLNVAGGRIEAALDEGHILAGERRLPVCELELELREGDASALRVLASEWLPTHGLWLSHATKAERGERLARGEPLWPVVKAAAHRIAVPEQATDWLHDSVVGCLSQIVPNADAVAQGEGAAEHVHQLRVGLRRLRTVLRELAGMEAPAALREAFSELGRWRDRDTVVSATGAALQAAGAPAIRIDTRPQGVLTPQAVARDSALQLALLELTVQGLRADGLQAAEAGKARALARHRLQRLHRQVARDADGFEALATEDQHRTRKRLKRLRYLAEFAAPAFDAKAVKRYLRQLEPAQDALGEHNDNAVALALYREAAEAGEATAWFAVGWLQGREPITARRCRKALQQLAATPRFWKD
ncbi:CYTH and CHAD domain-containing protein [Aquincola sp. J276]|uniref:CYTH and CHAD domain-containing protein n=1 Tax=Aquincola sp. J276 TaxID=2898432 RepID=UPI00215075B8|nr:CYTH and CHAD domain-containing protein [Aquincola sp. J276]MCR5865977.1 CHAD domain-containing protein [Aquincola sp. J276]